MKISTRGRYALRILVDLAENQGEHKYLTLNEIAQRQEISEKYLEAIIKPLTEQALVSGIRGKGGGYRLLEDPKKISVYTVLLVTEKDLAPVACLACEAKGCKRRDQCRTLPLWKKLDELIRQFLQSVTIADLIHPDSSQLSDFSENLL